MMRRKAPLLRWLISTPVLAGILFGCAGTFDLPMAWLYFCTYWSLGLPYALHVDKSLDAERRQPGPGAADQVSRPAASLLFLTTFAVAGLDTGQFHWTGPLFWAIQIAALIASATAKAVEIWAMETNPFFSTVIRIQSERGHRIVNAGPYHFIRHPGYLAMAITMPATALALGSVYALIPATCYSTLILWRTWREDRFLANELEGYTGYTSRVRFRLIPGIW